MSLSSRSIPGDPPSGTQARRVVQVATPETAARLGRLLERMLSGAPVSTQEAADLVPGDLGRDVLLVVEPGAQQERDGLALVSELRANGASAPALVIQAADAEPVKELPVATVVLGEHKLSEERLRAALSELGFALSEPAAPQRSPAAPADEGADAHRQASGPARLMRTVELQQVTIADLRGRLQVANEELSALRSRGAISNAPAGLVPAGSVGPGEPAEAAEAEATEGAAPEPVEPFAPRRSVGGARAIEELEAKLERARKERIEGEARLAQAMTAVESSHHLIEGLRRDVLRLSNELVLEQSRDHEQSHAHEAVRGLGSARGGADRGSEPDEQIATLAAALEEATAARERAELERNREVEQREAAEALLARHQGEARGAAALAGERDALVAQRNEWDEHRRIAEEGAARAAADLARTREDLEAEKDLVGRLQSERDQLEKDIEAMTARLADSEQSRGRLGSEIQELLARAGRADEAEERLAEVERRCQDLEGELAVRVELDERPLAGRSAASGQDEWDRLEELVRVAESQRAEVEGELAIALADLDRTRELLRKERLAALSDETSAPRAGDRLVRELRMDLGEWDDN